MNAPPPGAIGRQQMSFRAQHPVQDIDVTRVVVGADVLAHLDRSDRVERFTVDLPVVTPPHTDPPVQAVLGDPVAHEVRLRLGKRDAGRLDAVGRAGRAATSRWSTRRAWNTGPPSNGSM